VKGKRPTVNSGPRAFDWANYILGVLLALMVGAFLILRWKAPAPLFGMGVPDYLGEKLGVAVVLGAWMMAYAVSWFRKAWSPWLFLFNIFSFLTVLLFLAAELFFTVFSSSLPSAIVRLDPTLDPHLPVARSEFLDYLTSSPWVKFKPNTRVRSLGFRGSDFTPQWQTDEFGFKNVPGIATTGRGIFAVAIGDSFTEATGVPTEKTWESLLTQQGFPTYNLGVQGYSPQQMVGTLELYGDRLKPQIIIWGHTTGFEGRAALHADEELVVKDRKVTGGIGQSNIYLEEVRVTTPRPLKYTNAFLDLLKFTMMNSTPLLFTNYEDYESAVMRARKKTFDPTALAWRLTVDSILKAKRLSDKLGARFMILVYHQRELTYHRRVLGSDPPSDHYELAVLRELKSLGSKNDIDVLDLYPSLKASAEQASPEGRSLPFFRLDSHLNEVGQQIVAAEVRNYFLQRCENDANSRFICGPSKPTDPAGAVFRN